MSELHGKMPLVRSVSKGSSARHVYDSLRQRILNLEVRPGADLDKSTLVETYGVSRTPVREALIRLGADRLVTLLPNRGRGSRRSSCTRSASFSKP